MSEIDGCNYEALVEMGRSHLWRAEIQEHQLRVVVDVLGAFGLLVETKHNVFTDLVEQLYPPGEAVAAIPEGSKPFELTAPLEGKRRRIAGPKEEPKTRAAWDAYSDAYAKRYGEVPVSNQSTRGMMSRFIDRLGAGDAPLVAAWYLGHRDSKYVRNLHPMNLLLQDCESLRTQWATNRQMTQSAATQVDKTGANAQVLASLMKKHGGDHDAP